MEKIELPDKKSWIIKYKLPEELRCTKEIFKELLEMKPKERGKVKIFGKEIDVPRWQQTYGRDYYFSGITHKGIELKNEYIKRLLKYVREESKEDYKEVLINWYMDGKEYIGPHKDNEKEIVKNSTIYSISLGATRDFIISNEEYKKKIELENNDVLMMCGEMQKRYKHSLPKRLRVKEPRINITFRLYK